jgi:hypothetical protein
VAVLALLAAPAAGGAPGKKKPKKAPPVRTVSATATSSANKQQVSAVASCPKGTIALGGGFSTATTSSAGGIDIHILTESRRSGPGSWIVSALRIDNAPLGNPLDLGATVLCRSPKGTPAKAKLKAKPKPLRLIEVTATGPGGVGRSDATATCPPKSFALSGGFSVSPVPDPDSGVAFVFANHRTSAAGWSASLVDVGTTQSAITAHSYCTPSVRSLERSGSTTLPGTTSSTLSTALATSSGCSPKRRLVGGGFLGDAPATGASAPLLTRSGPGPGGLAWQAGASNLSPAAGTFSSFGYCL